MRTVLDPAERTELLGRLKKLTPSTPAKFGKFTAPRMVAHLIDSLRMPLGEFPTLGHGKPPMNMFPLKQLILYVLPIPPSKAKTEPELLSTPPTSLAADVDRIAQLLETVAKRGPTDTWADHPAFGKLDRAQWGLLIRKHMDHHLSQFGG
jgi:hypothetical protein